MIFVLYFYHSEEDVPGLPEKPIAMGIILGVVIPMIAIIALLAICIIRRQRKNKPPDGAIPELLKDNDQDEEEEIGMNSLSVKADMNGQIVNGGKIWGICVCIDISEQFISMGTTGNHYKGIGSKLKGGGLNQQRKFSVKKNFHIASS
jgi:hypothetical protein